MQITSSNSLIGFAKIFLIECFNYKLINAYWENMTFNLPLIPDGMKWEAVAYTGNNKYDKDIDSSVELMPRSLMVLIGRNKGKKTRKGGKKNV